MAINRASFNALVDDDGTNTLGTVWNKTEIKNVLLDPIDAAFAEAWTPVAHNGANYTASSGTWTVPSAAQLLLSWSAANHVARAMFMIVGTMSVSAATTSLFIALPSPVPVPTLNGITAMFHYYIGGATGDGYLEVNANQIRLLRDAGGTPFPLMASGFGFVSGQVFWAY